MSNHWLNRFILYWPRHHTHTPWMLVKALLSGCFHTVWFGGTYRAEVDYLPQLIRLCEKFGVQTIYSRWLFPASVSSEVEDAVWWKWMTAEAMSQQIQRITNRAEELGCQYTGVDSEVYNSYASWSRSPMSDRLAYLWLQEQVAVLPGVDYAFTGYWARSDDLPTKAFHWVGDRPIIDRTYYRGPDFGSILPVCDQYAEEISCPWTGGQIIVSNTPQKINEAVTTWTLDTLDEACEVLTDKEILMYLVREDEPEKVIDGLLAIRKESS